MGVSVGVEVSVAVGDGVSVGVGVMVGVLLDVGVGVRVTAGRSIGPVSPNPSSSRKIHPPAYCSSVESVWFGATCNQVASSFRALNARHFPTCNGSPIGT